jgi:hypothetical protein
MEAEITQLGEDDHQHQHQRYQLHNEAAAVAVDSYGAGGGGEDIRHYQPMHMQQQQYYQQQQHRKDPFADLDKTAYIIIFVAFIIGFFMGKTMQPVILKSL